MVVFYFVCFDIGVLIGEIVTRTSASSDWMPLSANSRQQWSPAWAFIDRNLAWIEMPPGGWVDGEFSEPGDWAGEHAYAIFLKPDRDAETVRILSEPYHSGRN